MKKIIILVGLFLMLAFQVSQMQVPTSPKANSTLRAETEEQPSQEECDDCDDSVITKNSPLKNGGGQLKSNPPGHKTKT